jgi:RCC1 and BTB domain-containing protein
MTEDGCTMSWGMDDCGQLGQGYTDGIATPVLIKRLENIKVIAIAAGSRHSVVLTAAGDVFAWGFNNNGQIGMQNMRAAMSKTVDGLEGKKAIRIYTSAFSHHTFVQTENSEMYAFGLDSQQQCGVGGEENLFIAQKVPFLMSRRPFHVFTGFANTFAVSSMQYDQVLDVISNTSFYDIAISIT